MLDYDPPTWVERTEESILDILTMQELRKWLETKQSTDIIGLGRITDACPIARYLENRVEIPIGTKFNVCEDYVALVYSQDSTELIGIDPPEWLMEFVSLVDSTDDDLYTAKDCLDLLNEMEEAYATH